MFLSKCVLDSSRPINPYQLHREIWKLFPDRPDENRSFLFRIENLGQKGAQQLLLQSIAKPVECDGSLMLMQTKKLTYQLKNGQMLRFLIRANPTKRIKEKNKTTNQGSVRVPIIDEEEMNVWLHRKLKEAVVLHEIVINGQNILYFRKGKHAGKIMATTFTGIMEVADPNSLRNLIENGIGPAKAFGCGLLSLARV